MRLVLASNNAKKLGELRSLFAELGVELVGQAALSAAEADEPHVTFLENALAKARHAATIEIDRPRLVTVEVHAPYSQRQSMTLTTTQVWLLPGRHIVGDGVVVEVPGFVVDVTAPQSPDGINLSDGKASVQVKATITTMCGCLVTPGGIWDADRYQVAAMVKRNGKAVGESPLKYAGKASSFEGVVELAQEGLYELEVYAFDPATGNSGLDRTTFTVY